MAVQRKVLIRNIVLAMVVADAAGIYYVHDRMTRPAPSEDVTIDDEAIAAAAEVHFKPQPVQPAAGPEAAKLAREIPKPAFGQAEAKAGAAPKAAPVLAVAPIAPKATAPAISAPVAKPKAAPALAMAKVAAKAPAPKIAVIAKPAAAPRLPALASASAKKPVTLSVIPAKLAKASEPVRKRASFRKAFASLERSAPTNPVTSAMGSIAPAAPLVTAQFSPEAREPMPANMGVTSQMMAIGQAGTAPDTALPKELGGTPTPTTASSELPPAGEE